MKRKLLTIAFALFATMLMAQNRPRRAVYNEYAGAAGIIGANFGSVVKPSCKPSPSCT